MEFYLQSGGISLPKRKIAIMGVGNTLHKDEGVGIHIIRALEKVKKHYDALKDVDLIDGGTGGLLLLKLIEDYDTVFIVDATLAGGKPGDIYLLSPEQISKSPDSQHMFSAHDIDLTYTLQVGRELGMQTEVIIIGVEPKEYTTHGLNLSQELSSKITEIIKAIVNEVKKLKMKYK
jgi:hydrogenase maturation protease